VTKRKPTKRTKADWARIEAGWSKGGAKAAAGMTPEQLSARNKAAARARWDAVPDYICDVTMPSGEPCGVVKKSVDKLGRHMLSVHFGRKNKSSATIDSANK
jgi:hypothetical protein